MDEFPGLLARDFGFRPQGKAAPMSASKSGNSAIGVVNLGAGSGGTVRSSTGSFAVDHDGLFGPSSGLNQQDYGGLGGFGGGRSSASSSSFAYDSIFQGSKDFGKNSSLPVYDKPVYDDDIFDGVPGMKSSASVKYEDVFNSMSSPPRNAASPYEDLLGNFGKEETGTKGSIGKKSSEPDKEVPGFDDLIPGFGGTSPPQKRETAEPNLPHRSTTATKSTSSVLEDPFVVLESTSVPSYSSQGLFTDPLEHISNLNNSASTKVDGSSVSGGVFDDINAFDGFTKSVPFSSEMNNNVKDKSPLRRGKYMGSAPGKEPTENLSTKSFENIVHQKVPSDNFQRSHQNLFDTPTGRGSYRSSEGNSVPYDTSQVDVSSKTNENSESAEDRWLTVVEITLLTQPTSAPPPSRPPPPLFTNSSSIPKADKGSFSGSNVKRRVNSAFPTSTQNYQIPNNDSVKNSGVSSIDELEDFAMGKPRTYGDEHADVLSSEEEIDTNSAAAASAAAMEAMDRAEAKLKQAREIREKREKARQGRDERTVRDAQEREYKEKQERLDHEREQKEKEEKEREQKRIERERERQREIDREKARQAVERATKEARDRAAAEARLKAERAAVEKANAAARERAERAAVQRAAAEARERAAADARERAEKAAAEARERAAAEARERAAAEAREKAATDARERAAVEKAAADVRLRAERAAVDRVTAEARERAAAVAREKQQRAENDLESFFGMGARPNSAPRQRVGTSDSAFDTQFQNKGVFEGARRTSVGSSSNIRKASSATNIVDDLSSIFGASPSSGDFQEVEGETEERRRARLERHQRTLERAAKALAEKNERDNQVQRDQAERHRIAETLDVEIKRWAAGKEANLRALLSTLQYVLWPECGWQPVSLTDLITSASVKKVYRKATLCIHPDKVQQKGANLQQKYIAEKVFDILKESWNKFNSEELF